MRIFVLIFAIALGVLLFLDDPVHSARKLAGRAGTEAEATRQPIGGLAVTIDLAARRSGRRVAILSEDWLYCYPPTGEVFLVPRGYETDFASIPPVANWAINPFGNHAEAAVIHDWLYAIGEVGKRENADEIFRFAMMEQRVNPLRRNAMYQAVRAAGDKAYGRPDEWRFRDPATLADANPPFPKPQEAAITKIDCANLARETFTLLSTFGTR